jgi:hypothetical protein
MKPYQPRQLPTHKAHKKNNTNRIEMDACVSTTTSAHSPKKKNNQKATHPSQRNQTPLLRKLHDQLLLIHRTRITRRMLLRYQQRRNRELVPLILPQQQPTRLPIRQRVQTGNGQEPWEALPWKADVFEIVRRVRLRAVGTRFCRWWWGWGGRGCRWHGGRRPRRALVARILP